MVLLYQVTDTSCVQPVVTGEADEAYLGVPVSIPGTIEVRYKLLDTNQPARPPARPPTRLVLR